MRLDLWWSDENQCPSDHHHPVKTSHKSRTISVCADAFTSSTEKSEHHHKTTTESPRGTNVSPSPSIPSPRSTAHMNTSGTPGGRLRLGTYQLAVAKATLWRTGASATFHPLLFAFRWPGGKHGGVNRKGSLSEVLMLQPIFGSNSSGWVVCQKAEERLGKQLNREDTR